MTKQEILQEMNRLQNEMKELEKQEKIELGKESWKSKETMKLFKRVLDTTINMFFDNEGLSEVKNLSVAGMKVSFIPDQTPSRRETGVTLEKNKTVERVSTKKDGIVSIARKICAEKGLEGLRSFTFHSDTKQARNWLLKNFPEALENR